MKIGQWTFVILLAALVPAWPAIAQTYKFSAGTVSATDDDTLRIGARRIHISAFDAPELSQLCRTDSGRQMLCGRDARSELARLIRHRVSCTVETVDRCGRDVATCVTPAGLDVGRELVRQGWAIPYWRYDGARYAKAYGEALAADVGIHAGTFIALTSPPAL